MARSTYIYIVTSCGGMIDSAFTVKHEMISFLPKKLYTFKNLDYKVFRFEDGVNRKGIDITSQIENEVYE